MNTDPITDVAREAATAEFVSRANDSQLPGHYVQRLLDSATAPLRAERDALLSDLETAQKQIDVNFEQKGLLRDERDELRTRAEQSERERDEARIYANKLRASINGSGPRDVDYMIAMEKENATLRTRLDAMTRALELAISERDRFKKEADDAHSLFQTEMKRNSAMTWALKQCDHLFQWTYNEDVLNAAETETWQLVRAALDSALSREEGK